MSPVAEIGQKPSRILIVDDERHNRDLLEVMLAPEGFLLRTAASGEEALEIMAQEPPDLILLDIMMPGMDGYEVASRIKSDLATKHIPVIMVTALSDRHSRMVGLGAGAEEFLTKPVDRAELGVRVKNLLHLKAHGDYFDAYSQLLEGEVVSCTTDLAERTRQAAVLAQQAALLDLAQDAIIVHDMQGRIQFWSRGAEVMYGWRSKEVLGRDTGELLLTQFSEPVAIIEALLLRDGQWEGEAIHHRRDGTGLIVASRWAMQRDADGAPVRILTINNDISGRKKAESERRMVTERLSLATAVAKVGVWELNLATNMFTWDATMFEIYGFGSVYPMPYATWATAVHRKDLPAVEATMQKAIAEKGEGIAEYRIIRSDGSRRTVSAAERVILDERGNVSRMIGVNMDVTERNEAAEALEHLRQNQMRFKDEFLSHVSHELRSPLTAIKQFSSILLGGLAGELNPEQRQYQQIVLKNIDQLQSMIDDLLEVTRLETGKLTVDPECVSLTNAMADTFDTLQGTARAKGITLSSDLGFDLPSAYTDQTRLRQILIILLDNAIKFTPDGGSVDVRARLSPEDPQFLLIEVSDTGCGISPDMTERLFERLYQVLDPTEASRNGLGLGLYICKELVTRQGGQIWVKHGSEKGSVFSFTLPVFSLRNSIAPLLRDEKWPAESVALVIVETGMQDAWPSKEAQDEWSREARGVLQRCLLPDLDVLLPSPGASGDSFFIAAFADETGASVLANRIRGQFERLLEVKHPTLTLSVCYRMLQPLPQVVDASVDHVVTSMAAHLEASIKQLGGCSS